MSYPRQSLLTSGTMPDNPSTSLSRRALLSASGCVVASVSGCSAVSSNTPMLRIHIYNQTDDRYRLTIRLYRVENAHDRSEARVFQDRLEVEPQGVTKREAVAEADRYLFRYNVDRLVEGDPLETAHDHAHIYPSTDGEPDSVAFDIVESGVLKKRIR